MAFRVSQLFTQSWTVGNILSALYTMGSLLTSLEVGGNSSDLDSADDMILEPHNNYQAADFSTLSWGVYTVFQAVS